MLGLSMTAYGEGSLKGFERWVERAKRLGFDFIEVVSEWPHYLTGETVNSFREVADSYGMKITVHAPFSDINIASFNDRIRRASLEIIRETVRLAAELDAVSVTVHPGHCSPVSIRNRERYLDIHRRSLRRVAEWGVEYGVAVGVENMPRFPILDAQTAGRLLELVDGLEVGVTFDLGHLNTAGGGFDGFLRMFRDRIVHVHLHDNSGAADEHLALGEGTVPWGEVLPKLSGVAMALEVRSVESARKSLEFLKNLHW
ncbi:sugar phosphate isomerase/epimerase [Thermococcus sp. M36]|uniref:sugar phosphate isomerase/epimerase family protein n=1 Tax=Thermococcus sp. M36 TaxID=1638261 RepID=UPI00143B389B|nr:sugar phosphate isomerase/epimerase family protein [Thermococcus sp. M36]NJE05450.1 sugar phosphate isomerase/epimerase [Thermococcus sp. M36]